MIMLLQWFFKPGACWHQDIFLKIEARVQIPYPPYQIPPGKAKVSNARGNMFWFLSNALATTFYDDYF